MNCCSLCDPVSVKAIKTLQSQEAVQPLRYSICFINIPPTFGGVTHKTCLHVRKYVVSCTYYSIECYRYHKTCLCCAQFGIFVVENNFRGFFWLHVDVKQGVQATSLLHSQHLEVPQATTLNSENTHQKCAGQSCVLNLVIQFRQPYSSPCQKEFQLIPITTWMRIDILDKCLRVRKKFNTIINIGQYKEFM